MNARLCDLVALTGRFLMASLFVWSGILKLSAPSEVTAYMASGGLPASVFLAVLVGTFEVFAGLALALGVQIRLTALALAGFTLLATAMFHNYWSMPADQQAVQQLLFSKNLAVTGALLFVAALGPGQPRFGAYSSRPYHEGRKVTL